MKIFSKAAKEANPISAWSIIRPYWVSEDRWPARGLLIFVLALNLGIVYINYRLNEWNVGFYNALQTRNSKEFFAALGEFSILAFIFIVLSVAATYFQQMLEFRWRRWITTHYIDRWLNQHTFYRIQRDQLADNPDQRISDDLQALASTTLSLTLDLLPTLVTLATFTTILWALSGPLAFTLAGVHLSIPGYLVWAAVFYALVGSYVIYKAAHPIVGVRYQQQRVEANFRFSLIRVRESAEEIALYDALDTEARQLNGVFGAIRDNWQQVMRFTRRLTLVSSLYGQGAIIFPFFAASPGYFAGKLSLGVLMQISSAFGQVSNSMSWFINSFSTLATWRATVNRLREFQRVLDTQHYGEIISPAVASGGIKRHLVTDSVLRVSDLSLALPNGSPLSTIGSLVIKPGSRWLVRGPSGAGKSMLFRALAGLWPFGEGTIEFPISAHALFIPQRSYIPIGSLRAAICYPADVSVFDDAACQTALEACHLHQYTSRLDDTAHWENVLSPGEQQRLALARVLLTEPDFVFLDEATSALDAHTEEQVYQTLVDRLPDTAIISIAHRQTLAVYHENVLEVRPIAAAEAASQGPSAPPSPLPSLA
ncbi:MAG: ABC transporter ATP-binding protein/permease [Janthinobacterium lividum]